jgi:RNA polymerase sigma factor (sigma-70 family)
MDEDKEWMERFKCGDVESFEALVLKYRAKAIAFSQRYVHDYHTAEDIAQESFASIYVYKERYNSKYSFKTYLFTILRNKSIDALRSNHSLLLEDGIEIAAEHSLEDEILQKEQREMIARKMKELKADYKTAIYLIDYEQFSYQEAAQVMGKSPVQMKVLIFRARKRLRFLLEKEREQESLG